MISNEVNILLILFRCLGLCFWRV